MLNTEGLSRHDRDILMLALVKHYDDIKQDARQAVEDEMPIEYMDGLSAERACVKNMLFKLYHKDDS